MIRRIVQTMFKKEKPLLGRWNLKHNCKTEDIIVHHTNRDHCGDIICGDPKKYAEFTNLNKGK